MIIITLVLFTLMINLVSAWGVAPARQNANIGLKTQEISINILNNDLQEGYFKLKFSGKLAEYAKAQDEIYYLSHEDIQTKATFTLKLPDKLDPGKNVLSVVIEEIPSGELNTVGASITLIAQVILNVPIEGEFVNSDVIIHPVKQGESVPIAISVFNSGAVSVPVWADISIKGPTNQPIKTITTEKKVLAVGETTKFKEEWIGETYQGSYIAEVTLHYGSSFKTIVKGFIVEGEKVVSEYISSENFNLGSVAPLEIGIRNNWNTEIAGVYSEIFVMRKNGQLVQSFKSISETLLPKATTKLKAYWDTTNLLVGDYDLNVIMHYEEETTQKTYPVTVNLDKLNVMSVSGQVTGNTNQGKDSTSSTLILLLIIVVVLNVAGLVVMKKYFGKKK